MAMEQYLLKFIPLVDSFFFIAALWRNGAAVAIFTEFAALNPKAIRTGFVLLGDGAAFWARFWSGAASLVCAGSGNHGEIFYAKT
jgi:hypothetical protein